MAVGAGIGGAVLTIVAEKMTMNTFGQRASWSRAKGIRLREDMSGRRENVSAIGKLDVLGHILRNGEGMVFFISVVIRGGRVYCGGRRGSCRRRRQR